VKAIALGGLSLLRAKRAVDAMLHHGEIAVHVPGADMARLTRELESAGVRVAKLADAPVDGRALRARLDLTQEQFALRFNLGLEAVQSWEHGDRKPDRYANNYLRVIDKNPEVAARSQEE
jgi:putative transcriptional regulator